MIMGTFNSDFEEQLNTCWSFFTFECEVENHPSWITKVKPELMMGVSLKLSVRQLHSGQNNLFFDSKISPLNTFGKSRINIWRQ